MSLPWIVTGRSLPVKLTRCRNSRRELHARVGLALERRAERGAGDETGVLAAHFFHAGDYERAWRYSRLSGDQAKGIYANVDAASFYTRALQTARRFRVVTGSEIADVAESLGDVRYRLGEFEAAGDAYKLSLKGQPAPVLTGISSMGRPRFRTSAARNASSSTGAWRPSASS